MNDKVDVLAVMNYASDGLSQHGMVARSLDLDEARHAVSELIEAIEAERSVCYEKHVHLMYAKIRTKAALARVKGE